ncbi:5-formyltetrahydrofolate cyclo-ligase [Microvirga terricola]|uniref:5-formyltetrahydrofolate cyclo-ligase n=1 Tax=Microvirga terricola TaxID=2719797 RepID=A0ABX0VFY7_9HYPH|nr:5-formyltetrahydrofolate cyclo-ligase [Microvirga terricola]NIX77915.1 5-formyltetrahydrofolate cyclo-ligase [Microvirga terricola]
MTTLAPPDFKNQLRREAFARREALDDVFRREASQRIAERALGFSDLDDLTPIGGYWPIRSEVDPRPLMEGLVARGQGVALSQMIEPHLTFRLWQPGDTLVPAGFGVQEPHPDAPEALPVALLVPLLAFDRRGGRIGYGKGYFDRAIAALEQRHRILTIGLAYAVQEIEQVPVEPHDRPLDIIVTETELVRAGSF